MDELKLALNTKFMKGIVTRIIAKAIYKKTGYRVDIWLNEIKVETRGDKVRLHMDVDADVNTEDLINIIKSKDLI